MPVDKSVVLGEGVSIPHPELVNLYDCTIGAHTKIGAFVEIQSGVIIGRSCKIQSHSFIPTGVTIDRDCFIGPGVIFTNDRHPHAVTAEGKLVTDEWKQDYTMVGRGASIGARAVILPGVVIGTGAMVAAGAVVTRHVPDNWLVAGVPARPVTALMAWHKPR